MDKKPKSDFVGIAGLFEATQIKKYFITYVLSSTMGKMKALKSNIPSIMEMPDAAFAS